MTKKVFISYSHKDEKYRKDLEDHLAMLKRKEIISVWHDREITPAEDWKHCIDSNLEQAELIIFLISPSFLASDYCYDIEVNKAIQKQNEGSAKIISIIVRPCDWNDCEFAKFQAVPKNAHPITLWDNQDSAWLDVIDGIKKTLDKFYPVAIAPPKLNKIELAPETYAWLDDTEIVLTHRRMDKVKLQDIYVSPDMEFEDNRSDIVNIESSKIVLTKPNLYLISGEEQQGKTSLLKYLFSEFSKDSYLPVYVDAADVKKSDINKILDFNIGKQYLNLKTEIFLSEKKKIILIDNLDNIGLNSKHTEKFLKQIELIFEFIIITCHSSLDLVSAEMGYLDNYSICRLLGLGNLKREELAKKWISLGIEESIEEKDLYSECDDLKARLNTAIKKNIVPPKPVYVLMLIQMFEAYAKQSIELTSYGHCYQQLIYQSLEQAKVKNTEYDKYFNVLTELSWEIFSKKSGLNNYQLDIFFSSYSQMYLAVNKEEIINNLIDCRILVHKNSNLKFKYPYIYYFFVGKKIAECYTSSEVVSREVEYLLENLHREDFANILIFITHHTKESWLLSKIQAVLENIFKDNEQATLCSDQVKFMEDFIREIPELVIEQREIQDERDKHNKRLDVIDNIEDDEESEPLDILATINKAFKGMDVAGQIIRNRHASMTRIMLYELADSGISTGLRFLDYFINISETAKNEIVNFIKERLNEHPKTSNIQIEKRAESIYLHMSYGVINFIVRKIASSIGSRDAKEIYNQLESDMKTPAYVLINQAIELQYTRTLQINSIEKTLEKVKDNPICLRILKEMVIKHIYMFPVGYKEKQQLSDLLNISIKGQRLMDKKKSGKG